MFKHRDVVQSMLIIRTQDERETDDEVEVRGGDGKLGGIQHRFMTTSHNVRWQ